MKNALIIILLTLSTIASARNYYVKSTGNDALTGLSNAQAWKTINKVNTSTFQPGDQILFNRGDSWKEKLIVPSSGSAGNPIIFGAYGSGNDPIIDGSDIITGWIPEDNVEKGYYRSLATEPLGIWFDGVVGQHKSSTTNASNRDWYWASSVLHIISTSDPSKIVIKATQRDNGIFNPNRNNITVNGIHIQKTSQQGILAITPAATGMVISNCEIDGCGVGITIIADDALITHNNIHDLDHMVKDVGNSSDFGGEGVVIADNNCEISYNQFTNCRSISNFFGYDGGFIEFYVPQSTSSGNNIHHNIIRNCDVFLESTGTIETTIIHHNIWINTVSSSIFAIHNTGITYSGFCLYNNTFYSVSPITANWASWIEAKSAGNGFILKNNIFYFSNYTKFINRTDFAHTYNCYYGGYGDLTLGDGEIANDPLFVDVGNGDFHLKSGSPAINAGTGVGLTTDYDGNNSKDPPSIGAYEYGSVVSIKYDADSKIINLYPNPNDGHFSIEFINPNQNEKSNIVITDLGGKQVYNGSASKEETLKQFDLSNIKSGIYVMMISDKEILVTKKIIIN